MFSTGARIGFFTGNVRKITEDLKALRLGDLSQAKITIFFRLYKQI